MYLCLLLACVSVVCVYWVCVLPLLCVCSLMCVYCMCLICVACICCWSACLCLCVLCVYCVCVPYVCVCYCSCMYRVCVPVVCCASCVFSLYVCCVCVMCLLYSVCVCVSVSLYVCICVYCVLCVLYLLRVCVFLCCVLVLLVTLLVWRLSWWCDGRLFFWVWWFVFFGGCGVCGIFLFFYSRFGVGGRLLLGFCYRTFFCGFLWGLCHTQNFFKDITHSYSGYVIPVMSIYMHLLAHLYHTQYCVDTVPVLPFVLVPAFACVRIYLCLCHPCVSFCVAPVLCLLYTLSCVCLCL